MQIRRLWHFVLGITCALAFNGLLIFLLIVSSPRKQQPLTPPTSPSSSWLKLSHAAPTQPSLTKPSDTEIVAAHAQIKAPEAHTQTEHVNSQIVSSTPEPENSLETEIFSLKGQELLAQCSAPHLTAPKKSTQISDSESCHLEPVQFYLRNVLNYINPYRATLHKKYTKLRRERAERIEKQPNIEITIAKNGSLKNIFLKQSSGSPTYDKYWLQAIKQACPLPKIPDFLKLDSLAFEV